MSVFVLTMTTKLKCGAFLTIILGSVAPRTSSLIVSPAVKSKLRHPIRNHYRYRFVSHGSSRVTEEFQRSDAAQICSEEERSVHQAVVDVGFRQTPFPWDEIKMLVATKSYDKLFRSYEVQYEYEVFRRTMRKTWRSTVDFILCDKFKFEQRLDDETQLFQSYPQLCELDVETETRKALVKNDFPYYCTEDAEHWVLWKLGREPCDKEDIALALQELEDRLGDTEAFVHWVNPPHLRSIPEVHHSHILCLRRAMTQL